MTPEARRARVQSRYNAFLARQRSEAPTESGEGGDDPLLTEALAHFQDTGGCECMMPEGAVATNGTSGRSRQVSIR